MGRRKKEAAICEDVAIEQVDNNTDITFDNQEKELADRLQKIQLCNKLIKTEKPFAVDINNEHLYNHLLEGFRSLLKNYINGNSLPKTTPNQPTKDDFVFPFEPEEVYILKGLVDKVKNKTNPQKNTEIKETTLDFYVGKNIMLTNNIVTKSIDDGSNLLFPKGYEVYVVDVKDGKFLLDREGQEGWVDSKRVL